MPRKSTTTEPVKAVRASAAKSNAGKTTKVGAKALTKGAAKAPARAPAKSAVKAAVKAAVSAAVPTAVKTGVKSAVKTAARALVARAAPPPARKAVRKAALPERVLALETRPNLVRDSFTMPEDEYAVLADVRQACLRAGVDVKKSELLRIGVALLGQLDLNTLQTVLVALPQLKTGRPPAQS